MWTKNAKRLWPYLVLALSLSGCATPSPPAAPVNRPPPAPELLIEPDLSSTYSDSVRRLLLEWQQKLTDWKRSS